MAMTSYTYVRKSSSTVNGRKSISKRLSNMPTGGIEEEGDELFEEDNNSVNNGKHKNILKSKRQSRQETTYV